MNNFDWIRSRLYAQAGIDLSYSAPLKHISYDQLHTEQCGDNFAALMDARLCMGWLRYGHLNKKQTIPFMKRLDAKLALYKQTGNTELLVDIANYARLEFRTPMHKHAHFKPVDRHD